MQTEAKVIVREKSTKRTIRIECPECQHSNHLTVKADLPAQKGVLECLYCGALLEYKESYKKV